MIAWQEYVPEMLGGLRVSVWIAVVASSLAIALGTLIASIRVISSRLISYPLRMVVTAIRNTPLLVQVFIGFYVLPELGLIFPAVEVGIVVLAIHFSTYCSEAVYSSIRAVSVGQWEAGRATNFSEIAILTRIVIPQAVKSAAAPLTNYSLSLFKDTAILSFITVRELFTATRSAAIQSFEFIPLYTLMGFMYLAVSLPGSALARQVEKRFS